MNLSGVVPQYVALVASAERLMELDALQGEPEAAPLDMVNTYDDLRVLGAEGLAFAYDDADVVFDNARFELPKGAFAVVTGASGIGKSTLLKLLLGIYQPSAGRLYARGADGCELDLNRSTRRLFAYVPQGDLLLSGTLRENLLLARPDASEEDLARAVHVSALDEFVAQLPQGLDTPVGESGAGLSGGQAQRLAIARAVLGGAPVLLLDECTSALDEHTEHLVLERLRALPERTCIVVTHRPAATELCDWQLEVHDGKIDATRVNVTIR